MSVYGPTLFTGNLADLDAFNTAIASKLPLRRYDFGPGSLQSTSGTLAVISQSITLEVDEILFMIGRLQFSNGSSGVGVDAVLKCDGVTLMTTSGISSQASTGGNGDQNIVFGKAEDLSGSKTVALEMVSGSGTSYSLRQNLLCLIAKRRT